MIKKSAQRTLPSNDRLCNIVLRLFFFILTILLLLFILPGLFSSRSQTSYLPEISQKDLKTSSFSKDIIIKNDWYILMVDTNGHIKVKTNQGETILSSLTYFTSYEGIGENIGLINVRVNSTSDSTVLIEGAGVENVKVSILLTVGRKSSSMGINVKTLYNSDITVLREALIAEFEVPVSEVYLKNRSIDITHFKEEYWLDKQGVRFGSGFRSSLIYHTPDISSLQLNTDERLVCINLDYLLDHPLIHIPYQADGGGKWVDRSASRFAGGQMTSNNFLIRFGEMPTITPRFMLVPYGYVAGYIFTEHADGGNIRTHRAAYFGSENIFDSKNAIGGFFGHDIPVTKSVFYEDFDDGLSSGSITYRPEERYYLEFLDQIYSTGNYDLCLHTPENNNSTRTVLAEAIEFMNEKYHARTWIDHGMFQGNNNRETFICDGLDTSSEFYAADLWKRYSTRYFWNPAVEAIRFSVPVVSIKEEILDLRFKSSFDELRNRYRYSRRYKREGFFVAFSEMFHGYTRKLELNSQRPIKGSSFPTPLYWQNITATDEFYSWPTEFDYNGISGSCDEENLILEKRHLDLLKADRGFFFNHGYYVRNGIHDDILIEKDGELLINPYFDEMLSYMDQLRDEGSLYITTVKDIMNYWLLIENIILDYSPDGSIYIINNNVEPVQGLSLALHTDPKLLEVLGASYSAKEVDGDAIIWFDLPPKGLVTVRVKNAPK